MLASSCPGWICYAEKTHPESIPYISTCRSPQQIVGRALKGSRTPVVDPDNGIANKTNTANKDSSDNNNDNNDNNNDTQIKLIHVTVMPCFDKKLEASRKDFFEQTGIELEPDVNFVLSTTEVLELLTEDQFDTAAAAAAAAAVAATAAAAATVESPSFNSPTTNPRRQHSFETIFAPHLPSTLTSTATPTTFEDSTTAVTHNINGLGSGGYLDYTFRYAARTLFNVIVDPGPLTFTATKNPDFQYTELKVHGKTVLKFARAYGFRSIQAVVRQLKRRKCKYDYIEIMACPSGCLNGGGQLRGANNSETKNILLSTTLKYHAMAEKEESTSVPALVLFDPMQSISCQYVYTRWLKEAVPFASARSLMELHTQYHAVAKLEDIAPLFVKW